MTRMSKRSDNVFREESRCSRGRQDSPLENREGFRGGSRGNPRERVRPPAAGQVCVDIAHNGRKGSEITAVLVHPAVILAVATTRIISK